MRKIITPDRICDQCGKPYNRGRRPSGQLESPAEFRTRRFCKKACYQEWNHGENSHYYIDGFRHGHEGGYIRHSDGSYVHRSVMAEKLGRPLTADEHVHHIDEDTANNDPDNLELTTNSEHRAMHAATQKRNVEGRFS